MVITSLGQKARVFPVILQVDAHADLRKAYGGFDFLMLSNFSQFN